MMARIDSIWLCIAAWKPVPGILCGYNVSSRQFFPWLCSVNFREQNSGEKQILHFRALLGISYSGEIHVLPLGKVLFFTYSVSWQYRVTHFILKLFSFTPQKYKLCSPLCIDSINTLVPLRKSLVKTPEGSKSFKIVMPTRPFLRMFFHAQCHSLE